MYNQNIQIGTEEVPFLTIIKTFSVGCLRFEYWSQEINNYSKIIFIKNFLPVKCNIWSVF